MKPQTEENIPRRRIQALSFDSEIDARRRLEKSSFCAKCKKLSLDSRDDAHSYIGLKLAKRYTAPKRGSFTLMPYRCPHGNGWHIGRNSQTAALLNRRKV
jgi:hypothetical protein